MLDIVERLQIVLEGMEAGLDDWPIASHIWGYKEVIKEIESLRDKQKHLVEYVHGCFDAAIAEGLYEVLEETQDTQLKDLIQRRLMYVLYFVDEHHAK